MFSLNPFYREYNTLALNWDKCCYLALCHTMKKHKTLAFTSLLVVLLINVSTVIFNKWSDPLTDLSAPTKGAFPQDPVPVDLASAVPVTMSIFDFN
jgi:hypothetical protein